jgi:N-acetylglucosaminyldiphosphoundecaprenol N-acetyl-beta-D-mannosaminyltransferase
MTNSGSNLPDRSHGSALELACRHGRSGADAWHGADFFHEYADVLGVKVSAIDLARAVELADRWIAASGPGYICLTGVHGVMAAQSDGQLRDILNDALINAPDGMPMTWMGRLQGLREMDRVFGPDFMIEMCRLSVERGYRHFLYGGEPGVANQLRKTLQNRFAGLRIVGTYTPPFRSLTCKEERALIAQVRQSRPDILWVGLSTPKQERFMAQYVNRLEVPLLAGVGAAFDYHTGRIRDCSDWIKRSGLQWLHRLMQDPQRLWRRYLRNNPAFLWHVAWQISGLRKYPRQRRTRLSDTRSYNRHQSRSPSPAHQPVGRSRTARATTARECR